MANTSAPASSQASEDRGRTLAHPGSQQGVCNSQEVEATQISISGRMDNQTGYIHTKEHHSALVEKVILTHSTAWRKLEDIMPSAAS